jgi:SAM-dependent methyltransferase
VDARVRNLLYREPALYDLAFPDADEREVAMCRAAWTRFGPLAPRSVLDLGCGTARNLSRLARTIPECWGVDFLESNIAYARAVRPGLSLLVGDMRTIRLGRTFDLITCFGNALSYALTDEDLAQVAAAFAAHAHPGTLLMVDALNTRAYLEGVGVAERVEGTLSTPDFTATSVSTHTVDRARRRLTRTRVWRIAGRPGVEDYAEYRLLEPDELRALVTAAGFEVRALHDNREFVESGLCGVPSTAPDLGGMRGRKLFLLASARAAEGTGPRG